MLKITFVVFPTLETYLVTSAFELLEHKIKALLLKNMVSSKGSLLNKYYAHYESVINQKPKITKNDDAIPKNDSKISGNDTIVLDDTLMSENDTSMIENDTNDIPISIHPKRTLQNCSTPKAKIKKTIDIYKHSATPITKMDICKSTNDPESFIEFNASINISEMKIENISQDQNNFDEILQKGNETSTGKSFSEALFSCIN